MEFSLVLPAFNEAERLAFTLDEALAVLARSGGEFEIVVVDDGSTDETAAIARRRAAADPRLRLVGHERNRGKGRALRTGFTAATGQVVAFLDADLEIPPAHLPAMRRLIDGGADVVIGSKHRPGARVSRPPLRRALSALFRFLVRLLLGLKVSDTQTGIKMFRRPVLELILARARADGYAFDVEALALAARAGARIAEVPVQADFKRRVKRFGPVTCLRAFGELLAVWQRCR